VTVTEAALGSVAVRLVDRLPQLIDEVCEGLREYWPDYADFLDRDREGVIDAARLFTPRLLENTRGPDDRTPSAQGDEPLRLLFEQIGRRQLQLGSDLTRLLTAFQFGSRVAWKHVSEVALGSDLAPDDLAALADAVFGTVNSLSFAAARGYLLEQLDDARARERAREELAALLLSDRASGPAVRAAAQRAGWRVPETAAVALVDPGDDAGRQVVDGLGPDALRMPGPSRYGAIIPEPPDSAGRLHLRRMLHGTHAVIGSVVSLDQLPRSVVVAEIAVRLCREGVIVADAPVFVDEHLDAILVWRDPLLLETLRRQVLAPLDDLSDSARTRLVETLVSWLRHQGDRMAIAQELGVHPQTVRYRLGQLREQFGDGLDDPRSRARLFLALQWGG
jgi:PucR C-terminal helix-turn-helix domain